MKSLIYTTRTYGRKMAAGRDYMKTMVRMWWWLRCESRGNVLDWWIPKLLKSCANSLITITVNTNLLEKWNRMSHKSIFIHTMLKIATMVLIIGKSLYLRNVTLANNLKREKTFGNTNWKHFAPLVLMKLKYIHFNHTQPRRSLAFI